jgi:hypothetical protein
MLKNKIQRDKQYDEVTQIDVEQIMKVSYYELHYKVISLKNST